MLPFCRLLMFLALLLLGLPATSSGQDSPPVPDPILPRPEGEMLPDPVSWPDEDLPEPSLSEQAADPTRPAELAPNPLRPFHLEAVFTAAVDPGVMPQAISLRDVVRMALENNMDVKVQRLQPELGEQQMRFAAGAFDPQFGFQTQYAYSKIPQNTQEFISTGGVTEGFDDPRTFTQENISFNWQLGGKTPLGTQYSVGLNQLQARNDLNILIPPSLFFPEYTTVLGLTVTQPLLRNFGPAANLAELRIARLQKKIGWYEWQQQIITSLAQSLSLYFDLIYAAENLRVRQSAVYTARMLERQNIRRVEAGKMRPSDVWEAQTSVANNADLALRAMNAYIETQSQLKAQILSSEKIAAGPTGRLEPTDSLEIPPVQLDRDRFIREALSKRPEYLRAQSVVEQEGIKVRYARNQVYPQVDLQASYGLTGLEGSFGNSFNDTFTTGGPALTVGVVVSVPLGSVKERAGLQAAKYREKQSSLSEHKISSNLVLDVETSLSIFRTTKEQVSAAADTSRTARLTAEVQEKLLEEGRATTFDVVRLQNDFADARTRELAALANHRKAILRLAVARGALLEELGVDLQDEADKTRPLRVKPQADLPPTNQP
ncbi:MAG: TolC family protein [Chthoniobacterales bacterium]|nr:TolC family protein [Chthoniobacterales bacterium]